MGAPWDSIRIILTFPEEESSSARRADFQFCLNLCIALNVAKRGKKTD